MSTALATQQQLLREGTRPPGLPGHYHTHLQGPPTASTTRTDGVHETGIACIGMPAESAVAYTRTSTVPATVPIEQHTIHTPLRVLRFEHELRFHPDSEFVTQLLSNLRHGCNIGYEGPRFQQIAQNLASANTQPSIIDDALAKECAENRMAGPYPYPPLPNMRCSGVGLVPKKDKGWRVIYHLSAQEGSSINDYIDPLRYSLTYCGIDEAVNILNKLGPGAIMGKIDLKNAFRICPVRKDWALLGVHWRGQYYVDKCLPFGLRSAPYLFNQIAEAIEWILRTNYNIQYLIHYLDDFFTAGPAQSRCCQHNMDTMLGVCDQVGAPVKPEKVEGPSTTLGFLGIELDSIAMTARLPAAKKEELLSDLQQFIHRHKCCKRELLSLIGKLSFACKVVPAGRIFLRRLIDKSTTVSWLRDRLRITQDVKADIQWWLDFLPTWTGVSLLLESDWTSSHSTAQKLTVFIFHFCVTDT